MGRRHDGRRDRDGDVVSDEPRCEKCGESRLIEAVPMPRWTGVRKFVCNVCSHTWIVRPEVQ
jgi:hypothetical protein